MAEKSLLIHVGGARGVGKSAVLKHMTEVVGKALSLTILSASAEVTRIGQLRFSKAWQQLTTEQRTLVRDEFVASMVRLEGEICILDSHYVDATDSGEIRSIVPKELYPLIDCHIVMDCSADALLLRRQLDVIKKRSLDKKTIGIERRGELTHGRRIARQTRAPFFIVQNARSIDFAAGHVAGIIATLWQISHSSLLIPQRSH